MLRRACAIAVLSVLIVPAPSRAIFHAAHISEVMSGLGGDPDIQFVEITQEGNLQHQVANTRLTWFNCDFTQCKVLMLVPANVTFDGFDVPWLMGSPDDATFFAATGAHADFYWDNSVAGDIDPTCGMVCWGAPGGGAVVPSPASWAALVGDPNQYTECVAYGGYTGRTKTSPGNGRVSGTPDTEPAGDGTQSLTRTNIIPPHDNLTDFALMARTPLSNDDLAMSSSGEACTPITTTTTTTTTSTTTTTVPPSKCTADKFKATGKKVSGKLVCHAKAVSKGAPAVDSTCIAKTEVKFSSAFARAETKGLCVAPNGDAGAIETKVDVFVGSIVTDLQNGTAPSRCTSNKLKATGKKTAEKSNCHARAVSKGIAANSTCLAKAEVKFSKAFAKADAKIPFDCHNPGGEGPAIETDVDTFVDDIESDLRP